MTDHDGNIDTENQVADQSEFDEAPPVASRVALKPFGADRAHELMMRDKAIRTLPRQEAFDKGYLTVKDLDDEELRYGRCRDINGHIPGKGNKKTILLPQDKYDAMIAEHELRFKQKLRQNLDDMLEIMVDIAKDDTVEPRDRFQAAQYLFERTAGKTPEHVNVTVKAAPWEELLGQVTGIAPMSRAEHRAALGAGIVDAEVVEIHEEGAQYEGQLATEPATAHHVHRENVQEDGQDTAEQDVVSVHQPRPHERYRQPIEAEDVGESGYRHQAEVQGLPTEPPRVVEQQPDERYQRTVDGEPTYTRDPGHSPTPQYAPVEVDQPDVYDQYGSKRTEKANYAEQTRQAANLAERRKAAKDRITQAKKARIIARVTGADAIKHEIEDVVVDEFGKLTFE